MLGYIFGWRKMPQLQNVKLDFIKTILLLIKYLTFMLLFKNA